MLLIVSINISVRTNINYLNIFKSSDDYCYITCAIIIVLCLELSQTTLRQAST